MRSVIVCEMLPKMAKSIITAVIESTHKAFNGRYHKVQIYFLTDVNKKLRKTLPCIQNQRLSKTDCKHLRYLIYRFVALCRARPKSNIFIQYIVFNALFDHI